VSDPVPEALASVPDRIAANLEALGADSGPVRERVSLEADVERAVADAE
jgi:hypothetical protein